uniref:Actin interacting protein 3-like C-terminal domain-containing protein n=1 Tax=Periophthalmus magnuspinnatus TaxID=409849 RepID=A0A3B3ZBV6_9GOBI
IHVLRVSRCEPCFYYTHTTVLCNEQSKSNLKVTSLDDSEQVSRRQPSPNGTHTSTRDRDAKSSRTVPRRHTLGGARGSKEILAMQPSDMDKKREAFLEHLKHKYPHHASAIMGHQERLRDRSPKHGPSPQPGAGDQVDHISLASLDSLEAMSEGDTPSTFTRGSRVRASLPVVRSTNQTKDRSLGVLYLQYSDETKQIRMPNEVTSIDTVRALFVSAFPQQLTMKMLESPSMAVYVKDDMRNVYYELSDVRNITDHSCLKVYHKDPAQAFNHGARPANGDARVREFMHGDMVHPGPHPLRQPPIGPPPHHPMQGALPPTPHSMPPSPSRIPFGPRQSSLPSSATMPRERLSNASATVRSVSPCPSAILERRDVKPDEDMPNKSHTLTRGSEGIYADPYMLANAHGPHPSPGLDGPEHDMRAFHRASIRSTGSYSGPSPTDTIDHPSLYRQKSRNSQLPTLGSKTPPPSPHRMAEVRMIDIHGPPHGIPPHRGSPVRQSFRKDDGAGSKARANMGGSPVLAPKTPTIPTDKAPIKVNLLQFRKNVSDLRMQLHQMRQLQLQNQEALRLQLKKAEQEISVKLSEAMQRADDPVQKQRTMVEEDRHKYLTLEERVLTHELEQYVGSLQKDSSGTQRTVTLKDVEEGAVTLRKVGESLAGLKGEFPALQTRMRAVLRVEVEAVKFLKEEPHKLDTMLKRVKMLTDILSGLRNYVGDFPPSSTPPPASEPQSPTIKSEVMPSSPVVIQQVQSSMVLIQQSQQSAALTTQPGPPLNTSPANSPSPTQSKRQGPSNGNGTFHKDMVIEELQKNPDKSKNRALSIKAAEKEWEERRQNMGHYDGKEFEKILQEAQANMMKGIPNLEVEEKQTIHPAALVEQPTSPNTVESPTEPPPPPSPQPRSPKVPPETKPKPSTPPPATPPVTPPAPKEEEDEGDKIMAELQVRSPHIHHTNTRSSCHGAVICCILGNASVASPTSRMPVPLSAKSRQSSAEKAGKQQKLQDAQRQFRQANGSAKRVGGDHKTTSQTVPVSKIPAFYPSSTKGSSQCAPDHATNSTNSISSSSSSTVTITKSSMLPARSSSLPHPTSHIPSLSNGSLKLSSSQHTGKSLSFSMQNGRVHPSSSSSSSSSPASTPSPLSPTPLGPGGKSIRTIHTPSFNSYRAHNGSSSGKSCIPTAAKDTA